MRQQLAPCQHELFDLGGELSMPGESLIAETAVQRLEAAVDQLNAELPPLKDFILPGGNPQTAAAQMARAICRRTERRLWSLHEAEPVNTHSVQYLNRLSDLLFVCARVLARANGGSEVIWEHQHS